MPHPHVVVEHSPAGYLRLLLSRPERRNALDAGMVRALLDGLNADKRPKQVFDLAAVPRNSLGKIIRSALTAGQAPSRR